MSNDLTYKVNFIMKSFYHGDINYLNGIKRNEMYFKKPQIWNMDTDVLNMLQRFYENIENLDGIKKIQIKNTGNKNKKSNFLYSVIINGINVTPAKKQKEVALSTVRQYCQILTSLDIVMFNNFKKEGFELECYFIQEKLREFKNMGFSIIFNGQKSAISWIRNLGFSLFVSLLYYKDFNFLDFDNEYKILEKRKSNSGKKFLTIKEGAKEIEKMYKETYKNLIKNNFERYSLEEIIDSICNYINENIDDFKNIKKVEELNRQNKFSTERSKFKDSIFQDRSSKNLILDKKDVYSDLVNFNNNYDKLSAKFNDLHACHIYEVKNIKRNFDDVSNVSNPHNGIMMKSEYHWAFDKGLFIFNEDGELRCREEEENYLFDILKLEKCKIRKEVFDESMKSYLKKRISS
ncbi:MAG: HNH endonuclease signature motif containing protein [Mycoplasmoidaceae bacterium]